MTKKQLALLIETKDEDLLKTFPNYTRKELRDLKKEHTLYHNPRILTLDIETAPLVVFVWQLFKQFIRPEQIKEESFIICWSAKWNNEKVIHDRLTSVEAQRGNDKRIIKHIWKLIDEADIVV